MVKLKEPKGKFIKVRCAKCKNEQVIFGKCATTVGCLVCGQTMAKPAGGKGRLQAKVLEILD